MKLFDSHRGFLHSRRKKEQERLISSSLTSSSDLTKRFLSSSSSSRSRPLAMRFHEQWRHPSCPVFEWYAIQTQSSTTFRSIQHWRNKQGPFFHEYLLILLDDGAICRVERMGEGSRRAAITRIGCTAHDIIQWFGPSKYGLDSVSREPAEMICQVDFPRTFDLTDVLVICWSIQQTRRCSVYTLQRYNCYFLCLTILAILARRIGEWEGVMNEETAWSGLVDDVMDCLQTTRCEEADEYMGLATCDIINPDHSDPKGFVLQFIEDCLRMRGLEIWRESISSTLWMKDLDPEIKNGFIPEVTADRLLEGDDTRSKAMQAVFEFNKDDENSLRTNNISPEFLQEVVYQEATLSLAAMLDAAQSAKRQQQMRELEYRPPLWCRAAANVIAPIICLLLVTGGAGLLMDEGNRPSDTEYKIIARISKSHSLEFLFIARLAMLSVLDDNMPETLDFDSFPDQNTNPGILQRILRSPTCATPITKLHALQTHFSRSLWATSLQSCVARAIGNATKVQLAKREADSNSHNLCMTGSGGKPRELPASQFHDYVWERIRQHGQRVESARLAAAELVALEIEITMSEVWKGHPERPGGTLFVDSQAGSRRESVNNYPSDECSPSEVRF